MRVVTISVNGLDRAIDAGFFEWLGEQDADVVCVQDHKARVADFDDPRRVPEGYEAYFVDAEDPAAGGVGIYTRHFPKALIYGFGNAVADAEGRFLQVDFNNVSIATLLVPSALEDPSRQTAKDEFMEALYGHLRKTVRKRRQFIFCGAMQTAHLVTDASPRYHSMEVSGFLPHERAWMDRLFDELEYVDAFRAVSKAGEEYTWWPEWAEGWRSEAGWRTDYQFLTPGIGDRVRDAWIDGETRFSDHAPLVVDYAIPFD